MKSGIVKAFTEDDSVTIEFKTMVIEGIPFVFSTYAGFFNQDSVYSNVQLNDETIVKLIEPYIRGSFEYEWVEPLTDIA